jgi:hypothetical protein
MFHKRQVCLLFSHEVLKYIKTTESIYLLMYLFIYSLICSLFYDTFSITETSIE